MFDLFRSREKSVRILLGVLLGLVALSMLWYLIPGGPGTTAGLTQNVVASVGDEKITTTDLDRAFRRISQGQQNLPKGVMAMYLPMIVNQMVESKAMAYKAGEMGLQVSDQELADTIQSEVAPALGGKFDVQVYQNALSSQGMTVADFERDRREAMLAARLENMAVQSLVVSDADARAEYQRKNAKIGLKYIQFDEKEFASKVNRDPAAVKAYFDKNRMLFRTPEKRNVNLIYGSTLDFLGAAQVPDAVLQKQYQENLDSYRTPDRVKVRHILIKTQGKPKEEVPKLKAKAEDLLKQVQSGGNFTELAKKYSDDTGSAVKGGELDWITKGQTVPNFEKTAFALKPGETSGLVETEYGYHVIQSEEKQEAHTQSFADVKDQLAADAKKQAATEALGRAIDSAHGEIARKPGDAETVAKKYNLKFAKVDGLTTTAPLPDLNSAPELTNAIFAASKGAVTDVTNLTAQSKAAFAVITNVMPPHDADFAQVQNDVLQKYTTAESQRLAQEAAKDAVARVKKGESLDAVAQSFGVPVKTAAPFTVDGAAEGIGSASLLSDAFKGKVGDIYGPINTQTGNFVCQVSEKVGADMNQFAANKTAMVQSLMQQRQAIQQPLFRDSVVSDLKRRGKIKINQETMDRVIGSLRS